MLPLIAPVQPHETQELHALLVACGLPLAGLDQHVATTLVARHNGQIIGSIALELYGTFALLRSVAVGPRWRNQQIARMLLAKAASLAATRGVSMFYLLTTTAANYFPRYGFTPVSRSEVPLALHASAELEHACPASALVMCAVVEDVCRATS